MASRSQSYQDRQWSCGVEYVLTNLAHPPHSCVARDSSLYSCPRVGFIDPYRESTSLPKACLVSSSIESSRRNPERLRICVEFGTHASLWLFDILTSAPAEAGMAERCTSRYEPQRPRGGFLRELRGSASGTWANYDGPSPSLVANRE